jgi:hypothetical protein
VGIKDNGQAVLLSVVVAFGRKAYESALQVSWRGENEELRMKNEEWPPTGGSSRDVASGMVEETDMGRKTATD